MLTIPCIKHLASTQVQRYEGASTVYGPYTLVAYQQEFSKLAAALANVRTCAGVMVCRGDGVQG